MIQVAFSMCYCTVVEKKNTLESYIFIEFHREKLLAVATNYANIGHYGLQNERKLNMRTL